MSASYDSVPGFQSLWMVTFFGDRAYLPGSRQSSSTWAPKRARTYRAKSSSVESFGRKQCAAEKKIFFSCTHQTSSNYLPEITKLEEINVPPQKYDGGLIFIFINATIHGNWPRVKFWPLIMSPDLIFGTPQVSMQAVLSNRLVMTGVKIAEMLIRTKIFSFVGFITKFNRSALKYVYVFAESFSRKHRNFASFHFPHALF